MNNMSEIWAAQIASMVEDARKHFPDDCRISMLEKKALENDTRAWDTLYWLSRGMTTPILSGA